MRLWLVENTCMHDKEKAYKFADEHSIPRWQIDHVGDMTRAFNVFAPIFLVVMAAMFAGLVWFAVYG